MYTDKKVLIVDDEEKARLYLASIVEELHPEMYILFASTPSEALYIIKKDNIDLVLLDVEMAGMTGLDFLANLREEAIDIPVVFVSAYKRAEFIQKAMRLDAVDYIDKPVNPTELENAFNKALQTNQNVTPIKRNLKQSKRFCLMTDSGEMFVEIDEIMLFATFKRYSIAYFKNETNKIVRENLEGLSKKLPDNRFLRVSRQHIVNLEYIKYVSKANKILTLQSGNFQVTLSRIYPQIITKLIEEFRL
jgi:two-component system, LytTR family, response regulator